SGETARHFMTQLSDDSIVAEEYYFHENLGFGTYYKFASQSPDGVPFFGSAAKQDPRNIQTTKFGRVPFTPYRAEELTPFAHFSNSPAFRADSADPSSTYLGKVTHPSGAPDNHLLTVWSPGPVYGVSDEVKTHRFTGPAIDSGIYVIKAGQSIEEPGRMLQVK